MDKIAYFIEVPHWQSYYMQHWEFLLELDSLSFFGLQMKKKSTVKHKTKVIIQIYFGYFLGDSYLVFNIV